MTIDSPPPAEDNADDERLLRVYRRPDGFHWLAPDGRQEFGPFDTLADALADMDDAEDDSVDRGDGLIEAEQEFGLAGWNDPETGEPAEDTSTRIEDL